MTNELLFFLTSIVNFSMVLVFYRFFGKKGLFAWMAIATIIANIEVIKCCDMFGLAATLGNVVYGSTFLATDIMSEMYGGKEARRTVQMGFFSLVSYTMMTQMAMLFIPNSQDFASDAMKVLFELAPRICLTSIACFWVSNMIDTYLYEFFKKHFKYMWMRNNAATLIAQLLDSVAFNFIAFWGVFEVEVLLQIVATTYIIKIMVAILDTPFLYGAKWMAKKYNIK